MIIDFLILVNTLLAISAEIAHLTSAKMVDKLVSDQIILNDRLESIERILVDTMQKHPL